MTVFVTKHGQGDKWLLSRNITGGTADLGRRSTRDSAIKLARKKRRDGEDIAVKGPRMNSYKSV